MPSGRRGRLQKLTCCPMTSNSSDCSNFFLTFVLGEFQFIFHRISIQLQDKKTALHLASANGYDEIVRVLLAAKARVNTQDKVSCLFCLHYVYMLYTADNYIQSHVIMLFMFYVMHVQWKQSPVFLASFKGHHKCVDLLINAGANVDLQKAVSVSLSWCFCTCMFTCSSVFLALYRTEPLRCMQLLRMIT